MTNQYLFPFPHSRKKRGWRQAVKLTSLLLVTFFVFTMSVAAAPTTGVLAGGIAINEVLPDPNSTSNNFDTDGNGTAETLDEFVEIYNLSASAIDISNFELWDAGAGLWFTFPAATTLGPGNYAFVIGGVQAGGSLPTLAAGNLAFDAGGTSGINNGGDNVVLYDPGADEYVQILYNGDAADNPPTGYAGFSATATLAGVVEDWGTDLDGVSLVREPAGDTNVVRHNTVSAANASPGDDNALSGDTTPPLISSFTPADDATDVSVTTNLLVQFNENVLFGSGNIVLKLSADDSVVETFDVAASGQVSISGNTVIIDPTNDLNNGTGYYVVMDSGAVTDLAGNAYQGFSGTGVWNFTTVAVTSTPELVISEIMYNPSSAEDNWEWVEIYNAGAATVDLSGYVIDDINGTAHGSANIASGSIAAGETAVLYNADDLTAADFTAAWGSSVNLIAVTDWGAMALNNSGDTIGLWDSFANYTGDHNVHANALISLPYDDDGTIWPLDNGSASIYLTDLTADATVGSNWALSAAGTATPTFTGYQSLAGGGNSGNDVGSPGDPSARLVISEIMYNPASPEDNWEWVEIVNVGVLTANLNGYVIDDINGTAHGSANIAGGTLAAGESAVLYNADDITAADFSAAWGNGVNLIAVTDWAAMALNNSGDTVGIWDSFASYSGDHNVHANALLSIAYDDDGTIWPLDDGSASIYLTNLAADGNDGTNWALSGVGVGTPVFTGYASAPAGGNTGGDVGSPGPEPVPPEVCGDPITAIYGIQGSGPASTLDGTIVSTEGVVTATFFGPGEIGGFFVQDAAGDGSAATSDGIYVFTTTFTDPLIGDKVRVTGEVDEFFGLTEITNVGNVLVCGPETPLAATVVSLPVTAVSDLEAYEGMLITFPQALTATDTFNVHRFGEVVVSANGRQWNPTNNNAPGAIGADNNSNSIADVNEPGRLLIDDGSSGQFPATVPYLAADNTLRLGDTVTGLTGVLSFGFSNYRLQPTAPVNFVRANPRPTAPADLGAEVTVATLNTLNYWTTLDDGNNNARGADSAAELARQEAKLVAEILTLNADIIGLQELENNGATAISSLVAALNAATAPGTWAYIPDPPYPGGLESTNAIKVGIIYQTAGVTPVGASVADDDPIFSTDRPPVAQTFAANGEIFTVIVNHFKSKGCRDATGLDMDQNDGQGCYNARRTQMAVAMLDFVATMQGISGDDDVIVLGDLNSYAEEDPITTLETGLINQVDKFVSPDDKYSFTFFGQSGQLDYFFTTPSLDFNVIGAEIRHINTDEPRALSYNDEVIDSGESSSAFEQDYLFNPDQYRSSDHDPVILHLDLGLPNNRDGCFVVAIEGSPFTGRATIVPYTVRGIFNAKIWRRQEGLPQTACFEIHGTDETEMLRGGNFNDLIFGYDGFDYLIGSNGDDVFVGGAGIDRFKGGRGYDTVLDKGPFERCNSVENGC